MRHTIKTMTVQGITFVIYCHSLLDFTCGVSYDSIGDIYAHYSLSDYLYLYLCCTHIGTDSPFVGVSQVGRNG